MHIASWICGYDIENMAGRSARYIRIIGGNLNARQIMNFARNLVMNTHVVFGVMIFIICLCTASEIGPFVAHNHLASYQVSRMPTYDMQRCCIPFGSCYQVLGV
jgi:hypothetical protein